MASQAPFRRMHTVTLHTCTVAMLTAMRANAYIAAEMQLYSICVLIPTDTKLCCIPFLGKGSVS